MGTITLHSSAAETSSGNGTSFSPSGETLIGMFVHITAVSGTLPTLSVKLQQSPNGTDWYDVSSAGSVVSVSTLAGIGLTLASPGSNPTYLADDVRCVWTIGGLNASFTFDVELTAF